MSWTNWRLLADSKNWYELDCEYTGPAVYELGTGGPRGGAIQPHYVGETNNESARMRQYASHGSHLAHIIDRHLRDGWCLYYHGWALPSKAAAVAMQNHFLGQFSYDWNILLNPTRASRGQF
jgi:hypothetical protein